MTQQFVQGYIQEVSKSSIIRKFPRFVLFQLLCRALSVLDVL
jgi:hypothetical protein